jgi:hypothetical protein
MTARHASNNRHIRGVLDPRNAGERCLEFCSRGMPEVPEFGGITGTEKGPAECGAFRMLRDRSAAIVGGTCVPSLRSPRDS